MTVHEISDTSSQKVVEALDQLLQFLSNTINKQVFWALACQVNNAVCHKNLRQIIVLIFI